MGWTQADLATASTASRQTVSRWLSDGPIKMDPRFAYRLQDSTRFSARWILLGEGPVHLIDAASSLPKELRAEMARHAQTVASIFREANKS